MRLHFFLPMFFCVVLALYKKNMMFTIMPGKTTCFLKKVARYKVIEVEYQVLAREGVRSNLSITMDVIAPHLRTRSHVVTSQRGPAGALVLDAALAGVYRFCFDNNFDDKNKKSILFNLIICSKKKRMKKQLRFGEEKRLRKKLQRLKHKKEQKEMLTWLSDNVEQAEILRPQRKGKKHTNSSTSLMKKKKKKKAQGTLKDTKRKDTLRDTKRKGKLLLRQPLEKPIKQARKQGKIFLHPTENLRWSLDDKNINLKLSQLQKMLTTAQFTNNKDINFIPVTETKLIQSLILPTTERRFEVVLKPPIKKLKEEEKTAWTNKEKLLQYNVREHSIKAMKKNITKDILLKKMVTNKVNTRTIKPLEQHGPSIKPQEPRIKSTESEAIINNYDEDDADETILTPAVESTTELYNVTVSNKTFDLNNIDNLFTPAGYNLHISKYPESENIFYNDIMKSYSIVEREKEFDEKVADYPSIDYFGGSTTERWDRAESSKSMMWMPYGWDMVY